MLQFENLDKAMQDRLRRLYYVTSITTALRIVRSKHLWSKRYGGFGNFSTRKNPDGLHASRRPPDVSLSFVYKGPVRLVPQALPPSLYTPKTLHIHVSDWPLRSSGEGIRVHAARLPAGTRDGLFCIGYTPSFQFERQMQHDLRANLLDGKLELLLQQPQAIAIPADKAQRKQLQTQFPSPRIGLMEVLRAKFHQINHWHYG